MVDISAHALLRDLQSLELQQIAQYSRFAIDEFVIYFESSKWRNYLR